MSEADVLDEGRRAPPLNRFVVHESVSEEFAAKFAARMGEERVGRGTHDGVTVGPLTDGEARASVAALVRDATDRGCRVITGGHATGDGG